MPEDKVKIKIYLPAAHTTINSPIPAKEFAEKLQRMKMERGQDPSWDGWMGFEKPGGKVIILNIMNIIGIEEV